MTTSVDQPAPQAGQPHVAEGRPQMANPAAWAVTAFATTSFMLGMYNTHLLNPTGVGVVIPVAFSSAG